MKPNDLLRGFTEVDDSLVLEMLHTEEDRVRKKKRRRAKVMRMTGIAAAGAAAAAILGVTLLPGWFKPEEGVPIQTGTRTEAAASEEEETGVFATAITPTMDVTIEKEFVYREKLYRFAGHVQKPEQELTELSAEEKSELGSIIMDQWYGETGVTEVPANPAVYRLTDDDRYLLFVHQLAWFLYEQEEDYTQKDDTDPAPEEDFDPAIEEKTPAAEEMTDELSAQEDESEKETEDAEREEQTKWVISGAMQELDASQLLYTEKGENDQISVKVRPILPAEQAEDTAIGWVLPAEGENLQANIAKVGDYLVFVRQGKEMSRICRKSFSTQEEEVLLALENSVYMEYTDPATGAAVQLREQACLLAASEDQILYGTGPDEYTWHVWLYNLSTHTTTDFGDLGRAILLDVREQENGSGKRTLFTIDQGSHDVSARKFVILDDKGETVLDRWSFSHGIDGDFLYYRDDQHPEEGWNDTVTVKRFSYADLRDEEVLQETLDRPLTLQIRRGLCLQYLDESLKVTPFSAPEKELTVPGANVIILTAGDGYYAVTDNKLYSLDFESGEVQEVASADELAFGIGRSYYAEDADVLFWTLPEGYGNNSLHSLAGLKK